MTAAALETLRDVEAFRHQARVAHQILRLNTEGLTQKESLIQPAPAGNCLNWVVGHVVWIYEQMLPLLGQEPVLEKDALKRYARGTPPLQDAAEALPIQDLLAAWDEASKRFNTGLKGLTAEALDRPAPFSPGNDPNETVRSLLTLISFHQAYHAGQTGLLRRMAGKEGMIK